MFGHRPALAALIALIATAAPASAATLHLKAPKQVERADSFRVSAFGKAKPQHHYRLSVVYQDDDQGDCARTIAKEVTRNEHFAIFYLTKVVTDKDGRFEVTSQEIVGGDKKTSGRFCGYLTNKKGKNKDRVVRRIEFT